ncbi:MAG: DUF4164 family protein [Devosiaceae bacterium]|nr:DUF4164 family protein [Devosiaceae bacterium MH13]
MAQTEFEAAFDRLDRAISTIEGGLGQRQALLDERERLYAEVARLSTDRAQLAQLLDAARAETRAMEAANQAVSQRLMDVMDNIRTVLAGDGSTRAVPGS